MNAGDKVNARHGKECYGTISELQKKGGPERAVLSSPVQQNVRTPIAHQWMYASSSWMNPAF